MSSLRKSVLSRGPKRFNPRGSSTDCSPLKWSKYFEKEEQIQIDENIFNVYLSGNNGPVLVLIHGGGYSALTWSLFVEEVNNRVECRILAIDLRGHGKTSTSDDGNLALDVLAFDIECILKKIYGNEGPSFVLVGHSLGGAVAVAAAKQIARVVGVCVIDVVEGTALESLSSMQSILRGRPNSFDTIEQAIQWSNCIFAGVSVAIILFPLRLLLLLLDADVEGCSIDANLHVYSVNVGVKGSSVDAVGEFTIDSVGGF